MALSDRQVPTAADPPSADRLDTWKEVAAHLRRSVRTVQRWEREEGLPVHRHRHDKLGSIYAFRHELDTWWATRGNTLQDPESHVLETPAAPALAPPARLGRWLILSAVGAAVAALVAFAVAIASRPSITDESTNAHAPHRLLIADFENLTGDPALSGGLRDALQEQLSTSRLADVVPPDQIALMLRLMKRPAATAIDATVGREISLRDGAIEAFITGTIDKNAAGYQATVRVLSPSNANVLTSFRVAGRTRSQLFDGVRRGVIRARTVIDAQLAHNAALHEAPRVTTASMRAFDLYRQAAALMDQVPMKPEPAFELLSEAVRVDPEFASAYILAAWTLRNAGRGKEDFLPYAERAFGLVDNTIDTERYFILGSYYQLKLEIEKSIAAWEALLRLDPRHYWALGNLGRLYRAMGRHASASELRARQVSIRPRQFWGPYRMAESLLLAGDLDGARRYAADAVNLASEMESGELQSRRSWFDVLPACEAWLRDDVSSSARIASELEATLTKRDAPDRHALATSLGYLYMALGQRRAAERVFTRLPEAAWRSYHLAVLASESGDDEQLRRYVSALTDPPEASFFMVGLPTLDTRLLPQAEEIVSRWEKKIEESDAKLVRGQIALMRGETRKARALLEASIAVREDRYGPLALSASVGLANSWMSSGDTEHAIAVLEEASENRFRSCLWPTANAHLWIGMRRDLARLYREVGREQEADSIEAQLHRLLQMADREPIAKSRMSAGWMSARVSPGR
jgi:tetratricopeptide (TPR) repeat protein